MALMGDAVIVSGTYQDGQGNTKSRFTKVGVWFESDKGELSVKLDALPIPMLNSKTGDMECWVKLFPKKDDQQQPQQPQQQQQHPAQQQQRGRSRY